MLLGGLKKINKIINPLKIELYQMNTFAHNFFISYNGPNSNNISRFKLKNASESPNSRNIFLDIYRNHLIDTSSQNE
jgi:hypothetical protein